MALQHPSPNDLCILDPSRVQDQKSLRYQLGDQPRFALIGLPAHWRDLAQLVKPPFSGPVNFEQARIIIGERSPKLYVANPEEYAVGHLPDAIDPPSFPLRFLASGLTLESHCIVNAYALRQSVITAYLQTERGAKLFELDIGWAALLAQIGPTEQQEEPPCDNLINFNRATAETAGLSRPQANDQQAEIESLKRALSETKRQLDEALKQQQGEPQSEQVRSELGQARGELEEARGELKKVKAELAELQQSSEAFRKQSAADLASQAQERFDLEIELLQLREQQNIDKAIEQRRIDSLQQSLTEAREALEQSQTARQERERELEESRAHLAQAQAEHQQRKAALQATLDEAKRSASESLARAKIEIAALQQASNDTEVEYYKALTSLNEELKQAQEAKKQHANEERIRLNAVIDDLNAQLKEAHTTLEKEQRKRKKLLTLLNQKHKTADRLYRMLKSAKTEAEITNGRLTQAEQMVQELLSELQLEIKANQEAWEKASDCEMATQVAKQELTFLKSDMEQEITNLWTKLQHQEESSEAAMSRFTEEHERLQQSLSESQSAEKAAKKTILALRRDRRLLREAKSELEGQLSGLEAELSAPIE